VGTYNQNLINQCVESKQTGVQSRIVSVCQFTANRYRRTGVQPNGHRQFRCDDPAKLETL